MAILVKISFSGQFINKRFSKQKSYKNIIMNWKVWKLNILFSLYFYRWFLSYLFSATTFVFFKSQLFSANWGFLGLKKNTKSKENKFLQTFSPRILYRALFSRRLHKLSCHFRRNITSDIHLLGTFSRWCYAEIILCHSTLKRAGGVEKINKYRSSVDRDDFHRFTLHLFSGFFYDRLQVLAMFAP